MGRRARCIITIPGGRPIGWPAIGRIVRLTGGEGRGRPLHGPGSVSIRPTSDRVREALFDILGSRVPGSRFLDLCAGTGAVGIEALSRGATRVVFVERDRRAVALIRRNLAQICPPGEAEVIDTDLERAAASLRQAGEAFAVVFLDPPYDAGDLPDLLGAAASLVAPGGILILEHRTSVPVPTAPIGDRLRLFRHYRHGDTMLTSFLADSGAA